MGDDDQPEELTWEISSPNSDKDNKNMRENKKNQP